MKTKDLLTLSQLARREGITEDAARKRAERGWYEKIKVGNRTYYRDMIVAEPEPEPEPEPVEDEIEDEIEEPEPPRPEKEPFPGAWEIADVYKDQYDWELVASVGKELDGDGEAVCYYFQVLQSFDIAIDVMNTHIKDGEGNLANLGRMNAPAAANALLADLRHCFLYSNLTMFQKWMDAGKPRIAPAAVLEQMAKAGDDEAKAALEMTPEEVEEIVETIRAKNEARYEANA